MKTAGQILREGRLKKKLSLEKVAQGTKIRSIYLEALEKDDYQKLPSPISARGFLKNYAEFLKLPSSDVLAVFRRDFNEKKMAQTGLSETRKLAKGLKFNWSPRWTTLVGVGILALIFIAYLVWQYFSLVNAPYY